MKTEKKTVEMESKSGKEPKLDHFSNLLLILIGATMRLQVEVRIDS